MKDIKVQICPFMVAAGAFDTFWNEEIITDKEVEIYEREYATDAE